jgi:DNA modification methylase
MCGSGTVAKICIETGRLYIGIDMSEKYCALTRRRVAGAQPPLFLEDSGGDE